MKFQLSMANIENNSNLTSDLSLKSFMILGIGLCHLRVTRPTKKKGEGV